MALAGITAVGEFHYLHHGPGGSRYDDPNAMGRAVIEAAREAGIRITLLDACYLHGGIGTGGGGRPAALLRRHRRRLGGARQRARGDGQRLESAQRSTASARSTLRPRPGWRPCPHERSWPLHAHVSEQRAENDDCDSAYGVTPTGLLAAADALTERFTAVHATHLIDADFSLLGAAGSGACLCPTTERDLADGIAPARRLAAADARLSLGTDSHALIDMFEEARAVELDERLESGERGGHSAAALLGAATAGAAAGIGWPEAGGIEPGRARRPGDRRPRWRTPGGHRPGPCARVSGLRRHRCRRSRRDRRRPVRRPRRRPSRSRRGGRARRGDRRAAVMSSLAIDNIGLLVTNDPGAGRWCRWGSSATLRWSSRTTGWPRLSEAGRQPIGASTRRAAA